MRWIVPLLIAIAAPQALHAQSTIQTSSADGFSYVFFADGSSTSVVNGNWDDMGRARALRAGDAPMLYVRQDGAAYVIRDPGLLARARAIMAPQQELGRRQGELGKKQGELGRRQGALGAEQGRLGRMMAEARLRELGELGRRQGELGRQQGELGKQQGELGRQQGLLGKEQARMAKLAQPKIRALVAEAIRRGLAQRVH